MGPLNWGWAGTIVHDADSAGIWNKFPHFLLVFCCVLLHHTAVARHSVLLLPCAWCALFAWWCLLAMWDVTRELAAHATSTDGGEVGSGGGGASSSEEASSFKERIEIPLAVSMLTMCSFSSRWFYIQVQPAGSACCVWPAWLLPPCLCWASGSLCCFPTAVSECGAASTRQQPPLRIPVVGI